MKKLDLGEALEDKAQESLTPLKFTGEPTSNESYQVRCPVCRFPLIPQITQGIPSFYCPCKEEKKSGNA